MVKPKAKQIWECKVGECDDFVVPMGGDSPMRDAVSKAYKELTGRDPVFLFSGWGGELTKGQREVADAYQGK